MKSFQKYFKEKYPEEKNHFDKIREEWLLSRRKSDKIFVFLSVISLPLVTFAILSMDYPTEFHWVSLGIYFTLIVIVWLLFVSEYQFLRRVAKG